MDSSKHYTKAPITEALIDLRVEMPEINPQTALVMLKGIQSNVVSEYPESEEIVTFQSQFHPGGETKTTSAQTGYRFVSNDRKRIFQVRLNGFSVSHLAPYKDWESLRNEAKRLWAIYKSVVKPKSVIRVAVRYLNRLDLPLPFDDFRDYLQTVPEVSPSIPHGGLSDYFMRLSMPQDDLEAMLVLQQAIIPSPSDVDNVVSVVLDIELFCEASISAHDASCWEMLERFRTRKNAIFEACITDKARRLFQ